MTAATNVLGATRAMATDVTVHGIAHADAATQRAVDDALEQFHKVEAACTRFDPKSPLMQVNARPDRWHSVPPTLFRAIQEADRAHQRSKGMFDPRVLRSLVGLGYDRSLTFSSDDVEVTEDAGAFRAAPGPWRPRFRGGPDPQVQIGREPVDLGGIGKGLAIRWAHERLEPDVDEFLIDAGGDIACRGCGPDGQGWLVAVENPRSGHGPLAVVALKDAACATSSIRLRRWRSGGRRVHHLIDPRTGRPGGSGLLAVSVIGPDPADAEVLSKSLFLEGGRGISSEARRANAAALWVRSDGSVGETPAFGDHVIWRAS
jgi:thiamine biosynthesis lipoprotein